MLLYRIARCQYAADLSGTGARLYGGRWNSVGKPVVYTASSRSLAVLEVLVHLPPTLLPSDYCMAVIEVPDDIENIEVSQLPAGWNEFPEPAQLKLLGDGFLNTNRHLLLRVPSVIIPQEHNYLLNPAHSLMQQVKVVTNNSFSFDERLL